MTSTATEIAYRMAAHKAARDEKIIRALLGRWISEFEPSVAMRNGEVIGLCVAGDPSGSIPVRTIDMREVHKVLLGLLGIEGAIPEIVWPRDLGYD